MLTSLRDKLAGLDKRIVAGVIGVSLLGYASYYFFIRKDSGTKKPPTTRSKPIMDKPEAQNQVETEEKALIRTVNNLKKLISEEKALDLPAVKAIYSAHFQLSRREFRELTLANREERRKFLRDIVAYNRILSAGANKLDTIHNKHLNAILAHLKVEESEWVELTEEAANLYPDQWDEFILQNDNQELDSIREKNKPQIKVKMLIEIEKFRITQLKERLEEFRQTFQDLDPTDIYSLLENWGRDVVYQKFKVQEEDIQYSLLHLSQQDKESLQPYEEQLRNLMESIVMNASMEEQDQC